jgi:A/G-specific adenine glycosylase
MNGDSLTMERFDFQNAVVSWYKVHGRDFPWRQTQDPFHVLVAEVLLRQTQASRVAPFFQAFIKRYPSPQHLADVDLNLLRLEFSQLGLTNRADTLQAVCRSICSEYRGKLPRSLRELSSFSGLGIYSSRAILCLSFGECVPMVDESVGRMLRRVLGRSSNKPAFSDKDLLSVAENLIPRGNAVNFNLGLIDIASAHCRPRRPACEGCPLLSFCRFAEHTHEALDA